MIPFILALSTCAASARTCAVTIPPYPILSTQLERESRTSRDVVLPQIKDWLTFLQNGTLVGTAESRRPRNRPEKGPSRGSCPPVKVSKSASSCIVPHKVSIFGVKSEEFGGEKCNFPSAKVEAIRVVEKFHSQPPPPHTRRWGEVRK